MGFYEKIMSYEKSGKASELDNRIRIDNLVSSFVAKEPYSVHTTVALLYSGLYPNKPKMYQSEIVAYIENVCGNVKLTPNFMHNIIRRIKTKYHINSWPNVISGNKKGKRGTYNSGFYQGKCMICDSVFNVDIEKHPSNLCACLDCCPNGIHYGSSSVKDGFSTTSRYQIRGAE